MRVTPVDVYDKNGNLIRLDFFDSEGEFVFQAEWDERDEQTSPNREAFRKWAYTMAKRMDYEVDK